MPKLVGFDRKYSDSLEKYFEAAIHSGHSRWIGIEGKLKVEKFSLDELSTLSRDSASADYPRSSQSVLEKLLDNYRLVTPMDQPKNGVNRAFHEREVNTVEYASICQQLRHDLIEYLRLLRPQPTTISKIDEDSYRQRCEIEIPWFCASSAASKDCGLPFINVTQELSSRSVESDDSDTFSVGSLLEEMGLQRHAVGDATLKELTEPTCSPNFFYPLERIAAPHLKDSANHNPSSPTQEAVIGTIAAITTSEEPRGVNSGSYTKRISVDKSAIDINGGGRKRADSNLVKDIFHASSSGRRLSRSERSKTKVTEVQPNSQKPIIVYVDTELSRKAVLVDIEQNHGSPTSVQSEKYTCTSRVTPISVEPKRKSMIDNILFTAPIVLCNNSKLVTFGPKRPLHMRAILRQQLFNQFLHKISYLPRYKCPQKHQLDWIIGQIVTKGWIPINLNLIHDYFNK